MNITIHAENKLLQYTDGNQAQFMQAVFFSAGQAQTQFDIVLLNMFLNIF